MRAKAPRRPARLWPRLARGAFAGLCLWLAGGSTAVAQSWRSELLVRAEYTEPTGRYPHDVLGDPIEYGALLLTYTAGWEVLIRLPSDRVFEDIAPRLVDVDGDSKSEAIVVESHKDTGARFAVYNGGGLMAATPFIGTRFRWLAPIGAADLDGDGQVEIAYIDRPHLAKRLRLWRFQGGNLVHLADKDGLTNHRIGEDFISGGLRACNDRPEFVTANADWTRIMSTTFDGITLQSQDIGPYSAKSIENALTCD